MGGVTVRSVAFSKDFDTMVEEMRKMIGMNRSAFVKHCILTFLESQKFIEDRVARSQSQTPKAVDVVRGGSPKK